MGLVNERFDLHNSMLSALTHHASGPAVHYLCQAKLELAHKLFGCLWYPTIPLQFSDTLGDCQHLINPLNIKEKDIELEVKQDKERLFA